MKQKSEFYKVERRYTTGRGLGKLRNNRMVSILGFLLVSYIPNLESPKNDQRNRRKGAGSPDQTENF
jgi:hypothetical protein